MEQTPIETQKRKRSVPRPWGCLRLLLIPIVLAVACYGGMWLFARYGGEWAMSDQISVPPGSRFVESSYSWRGYNDPYAGKSLVYLTLLSPQQLYSWYRQAGMPFELNCRDVLIVDETTECYDNPVSRYFGYSSIEENRFGNLKLTLYRTSLWLTSSAQERWRTSWDVSFVRFGIQIFDPHEMDVFQKIYPNVEFSDDTTAFVITLTWPSNPEVLFPVDELYGQ